jgi:large conductance mechanosensitive channel
MLNDFKKFAVKGSVVDIAIGMILGGGITPIAKALVDDMIMPVVGLAMGRVDFRNLFVIIKEGAVPSPYATLDAAKAAGAVTVNYGIFINTLITFVIVAFAAYLIATAVQRLRKSVEADPVPPTPSEKECPLCLSKVPLLAKKCAFCTSSL